MEDMAPELLQTIRLAWQKALISDAELRSLTKRITEGKATYKEVEDIAYRVGKDLSKALVGNITSDIMPDGHVPQNVAEKILQPTLREAHAMVIEAATKTQEAMNKAAGIGLKAQAAEFDAEKAQGLVYKLTNGLLEDTGWILDAPVTEFVQSSADRTLKKNVDFQARAGLHPIITREAEGKCCKWCSNLEGSYEYGDEPQDIYKRHRRCRCVVDYRPGNGKRQNVWSKAWHEDAKPEKVEERRKTEKGIEKERKKKRIVNFLRKNGDNPSKNGIIESIKERMQSISDALKTFNLKWNEPKKLENPLSTSEIIAKVHGADRSGHCTSLALAYIGNKLGFDVKDFRHDKSVRLFAEPSSIKDITRLANGIILRNESDFEAIKILKKHIEPGKEYFLSIGQHSAIVRKNENGYEYLKLQSNFDYGFRKLTKYELTEKFNCKGKTVKYGITIEFESMLFDIEALKENKEFEYLLGFVNKD